MVDDVRNFLFGSPNQGGLDLASINIHRGRERGIANFNTIREDFGLPRVSNFQEICDDLDVINILTGLYGNVDNIDAWVGLVAEKHMPNAMFGETILTIMERQFQALRDGDRFYFENDPAFSENDIKKIKESKLQDVIMRNTNIELMQEDVFNAMPHEDIPNGPYLEPFDLNAQVYPNPTESFVYIKVYSKTEQPLRLRLIDPLGKEIMQQQKSLVSGDNFLELSLMSELPRGVYNILLESDESYSVVRVVKER